MAEKSICSQLIDQHGHFNEHRIEDFKKELNLAHCGLKYAVVSIMGPQSSGKSTLLNHLFHTNFKQLDARKGRSQTTKGIELARGVNIHPCTIVLDLEGSDGSERGEDDTMFEKQSALFALAVSDIVLINLWYHDIGRVQAANMPLLKTVFQVFMTRLFGPHKLRKTTLLFVIRDTSETPLEELKQIVTKGIQKIWVSIHKPKAYRETPLDVFFNVVVVALPSYKYEKEQFEKQVAILGQRFYHSIAPGGLAGDRRTVVPAADFLFCAQQIWKHIKESKDLMIPAHNILVATIRCEEIAKEKSAVFSSDKEWSLLKNAVQHGLMQHFGQTLSRLLHKFLSGYDTEAQYFDDGVRTEKRKQLKENLLRLAYPAYESVLEHLRSKTLDGFKEAFNKALQGGKEFAIAVCDCTQSLMSKYDAGCEEAFAGLSNWDCKEVREKFMEVRKNIMREIGEHVAFVHADKMSDKYKEATTWNNNLREAILNLQEVTRLNNNINLQQATRQNNNQQVAIFNHNNLQEVTMWNNNINLQQATSQNNNQQVVIFNHNNLRRNNNLWRAALVAGRIVSLIVTILTGGIVPYLG